MNLMKYPAYSLAAITALLFSIGFLYEYAYLDFFGIASYVFSETYADFLLYSFYALLFQFLLNETVLYCAMIVLPILVAIDKLYKSNLKYKVQLEHITRDKFNRTFVKTILACTSPLLLIILVLILMNFGNKEANSVMLKAAKNEQTLTLKNKKEITGALVRKVGDTIIFYGTDDASTHIYNSSEVISITYKKSAETKDNKTEKE